MKVRCINKKYYMPFTIGKIYDVIEYDGDEGYLMMNDDNYQFWYSKKHFKSLSKIRKEKINKLLKYERSLYKK